MIATGDTIASKYRIERLLGQGGMGAVYAAEHLLLQQRVAIKVIASEAAGPGHRERFLREARAASRVRSEHVTQVFDVGELSDGTIYMVLELLDGHDLSAFVRERGRPDVEDAVSIVLEALIGVAAAHASGVIHRDLKLENLFLARRPNGGRCVKVLDFGISKSLGEAKSLTASGTMVGSPYSMSPEQIRDAKSVDARTDVWAMGVVAFMLLTGEEPFTGEDVGGVIASILEATPKSPRSIRAQIPEGLDGVVIRALAKDRQKRFQNVADLADALAPFAGARGPALAADVRRILGVSGMSTLDTSGNPDSTLLSRVDGVDKLAVEQLAASREPSGDAARAASAPAMQPSHASEAFAATTESRPGVDATARERPDQTVGGVPLPERRKTSSFLYVGVIAGFMLAAVGVVVFGGAKGRDPSGHALENASPDAASGANAASATAPAGVQPGGTVVTPGEVSHPSPTASAATSSAGSASATPLASAPVPSTPALGGQPRPLGKPNGPATASAAIETPKSASPPPAGSLAPAAKTGDPLFNQGRQ